MAYSLLPRVAALAFAADGTPALNLIGTQLAYSSRSVDGLHGARKWAEFLFANPKFPAVDHIVITLNGDEVETLRKPEQAPAAPAKKAKPAKPECRFTLGRKLTARKAPAGLTAYAVVGHTSYQVAVFNGAELVALLEREDGYTIFTPRGRRMTAFPARTLGQAMAYVA